MTDPRLSRLAKVLVHYSVAVKKGDWVRIEGSYLAEELMRQTMVEVLKAGGHPMVRATLPGQGYLMYKNASKEQLEFIPPSALVEVDKLNCRIFFWGGWNSKELTGVDPKRIAVASRASRPMFDKMLKRISAGDLRWVGTMFPTQSAAQDAEMALEEYEEFVFKAGMLHKADPVAEWKKLSARQAKLARRLDRLSTVRITGPDTDLSFRVKGRKWINCDGQQNFPDGEVFTCPLEDSAEGHIRYSFPAVYGGREVENVRLVFKKGKVVEAKADKGEDFLNAMLDTDPGGRYVGELAFGTNYAIQRFTKNTLFDEKIGGTIHIAVGASLPEAGGRNKSGVHWDMVCDTRKDACIYGDGKPIARNGKFLI